MTIWLLWNSLAPERLRFDSASLGFTTLTLMLSLQASYASPLILLAQNRQDERDRVSAEQDRQHAVRTLADTEFLTGEIASLRMSLRIWPHATSCVPRCAISSSCANRSPLATPN